ncbi:thermonuclease family protein [Skermanella stibiiresistens]|uniref:thermonuclease family protein n=1 Tax=Skermanella stibiiresistens TaxID=913326 RepID=UPI0009FFC3DC|nr:thermonuclease family protein [Skermanella stibiiresistens]
MRSLRIRSSKPAWVLAVAWMLALGHGGALAADPASGSGEPPVHVIDGDTVEVSGIVHQLGGIDAPELGQRCLNKSTLYECGHEAAFALRKMLGFMPVSCNPPSRDQGGGEVQCVGRAGNLALLLVQQGMAVAKPGASPEYSEAQRVAKDSRLGIWRGDFVSPERWRAGERLDAERQAPAHCPVKAFVQDGVKVYIVPTDPGYGEVSAEPATGERRFCGDEQAAAAGYEHAGSHGPKPGSP